jgi:hypothetical protein
VSDISANDKNYRRGLVLGLSLAELFIILLFLLLLATVGFVSMLEEKQRLQQEEINILKSELQAIEKIFGKNPLPEDFRKLVREAAQAAELMKENKQQKQLLSALKPIVDAIASQEMNEQQKSKLIKELAKAIENINSNQFAQILEAAANSPNILDDLNKLSAALIAKAKLEKENKELANLVEALGKERGDNPPCLFRDRDKEDRLYKKKPYKEIYSFDVFLRSDGMLVKQRELEPGNHGKDPSSLPSVSSDYLNQFISFSQFQKGFSIYKEVGQSKLVQPYPCAFFVRVWWDTKMSSRQYDKAINQVEGVFFKDVMRNSPWPH